MTDHKYDEYISTKDLQAILDFADDAVRQGKSFKDVIAATYKSGFWSGALSGGMDQSCFEAALEQSE